jgi:hypothetical protein
MNGVSLLGRIPSRPILWMATLLHLITGIMLTIDPRVGFVTGLRIFVGDGKGTQPALAGLLFVCAGLLGVAALWRDFRAGPNAWTFWAFLPQQMLLFVIAGNAVFAIIQGHYSSGTVLPRSFIFVDQLSKLLLTLLHPLGILSMHLRILPARVTGPIGGAGGMGGHGGAGGAGFGGEPGDPGEPGEPGEPGRG